MKKLTTLTIATLMLLLGSSSIEAQYGKKHRAGKKFANNGFHKAKFRRASHTYYKTKYKWYGSRKYKLTYKIRVFPNGIKRKKLVDVKRVRHNRYGRYNRVKTYYRSYTIFQGWKPYRVTYKIKKFPNGRTKKKLVSKVRLRYW